jgi:hypothetical protein
MRVRLVMWLAGAVLVAGCTEGGAIAVTTVATSTTTGVAPTTTVGATTTSVGSTTAAGPGLGLVWLRVPNDEAAFEGSGDQMMSAVVAGGPGLVAVGDDVPGEERDAAVWTSADGLVWSRVPHDEAVFGGVETQMMSSVAVGGPGLVAVGYSYLGADGDAAVWTSADG